MFYARAFSNQISYMLIDDYLTHKYTCSLKPYNIKGKTVTTNVVDGTGVPLSVMIRQTISGLEGQCCLSGSCSTVVGSCSTVVGSCSTAWEVVALHCTEDRDVRAFFFRDKDSLFFLAGGASEGSSASGGAGEGSSASKNQPSGNKFPSPSIFKKLQQTTNQQTTNQLKYRLRSYSTKIIGLGESSRSTCSTRASRSCYMTFSNFPRAQ